MKEIKKTKSITIITNAIMALMMFVAAAILTLYGTEKGIDLIFVTLVAAVFIYLYLYCKSIDISNKFYELIIKEGIDPEKI